MLTNYIHSRKPPGKGGIAKRPISERETAHSAMQNSPFRKLVWQAMISDTGLPTNEVRILGDEQ